MSEGAEGACFTKGLRSISLAKKKEVPIRSEQMAPHDCVIRAGWMASQTFQFGRVLEANNLRDHAEQTLATPTDPDLLQKHKEVAGHAKRLIMDGIKDHIVPHLAEKKTANEMWKALISLYEGKCVQRKTLLETQMSHS